MPLARWSALVVLLLGSLAQAGPAVTFATTHYPPYSNAQDPQGGAMVRVLHELLEPMGYQVTVRTLPWQRLLQEKRRYDGILVLWPNEAQELGLVAYQGLFRSRLGFFTRADTPVDVRSIPALGKRATGATRGYGYPPALLESQLQIEYVADDVSNLRKLQARRFDLVALERVVGEHWIRQLPELRGLEWNEPPMAEIPLGLAVVPGRPATERLGQDLEHSLRQYRTRGELQRLARTYQLDLLPVP